VMRPFFRRLLGRVIFSPFGPPVLVIHSVIINPE
jgi:hypothetical protein